jgi:hypothetical protein
MVTSLRAQTTDCNCKLVFEELTDKLEANYLGLKKQVLTGNSAEYNKRKATYHKKSPAVNAEDCTEFLQEFVSFFNDEHLFVFERPKFSASERETFKIKAIVEGGDVNKLLAKLEVQRQSNNANDIIGKWSDGTAELVILQNTNWYEAYVINSKDSTIKPGELRARFKEGKNGFTGKVYSSNYTPRYVSANVYKQGTLLAMDGGIYWGRLDSTYAREMSMINRSNILLPTVQKIDEETTVMSIPSFSADGQQFIAVLLDNLELFKSTTNLILDIRGNTGGNALYFAFLDAYAARSLPESQGFVLASNDTKNYFELMAKQSPEVYAPVVERIQNNFGKIVDGPLYPGKSFKPFESKIAKVAILTDGGCKSAAESLILHSKAVNDNVITFGSPTAGVIDYTSVNTIKLPLSGNQNIYFGYPTSSWDKQVPNSGYNANGIVPDVSIAEDTPDKIQFIIDYLKRK